MPEEKEETQQEQAEPETEAAEGPEDEGEPEEEITIPAESTGGGFFGPAIIILFLAMLLDAIGLVLLVFALDDFFLTDIIGTIFIGGWIWFHSGTMQQRGAAGRAGKGAKTAKRLKRLRPLMMAGEFIPYIGALPCWTILVYFELKS